MPIISDLAILAAATDTNNAATSGGKNGDIHQELLSFIHNYWRDALGAVLIFVLGIFVSRWLGKVLHRWLAGQPLEPPVRLLMVRVARLGVMFVTLVMVLDKFGVPITTLITSIGVIGVGVGLALQSVLSNLVAGLTIIFTRPFRVGEYIELGGVRGLVRHIDLFSTSLEYGDLSTVIVPNKNIVGEVVHNYGGTRQLNLTVGIGYSSNLPEVFAILREIMAANPRVLKIPTPGLGISSLSDSSIVIAVKPWTSLADYGAAQAEIYEAIIERFRARRVEIPFPQQEVRLIKESAEPKTGSF